MIDIESMLKKAPTPCPACGKVHYAGVKDVCIKEGALGELAGYVRKYGGSKAFLLADCNTWEVAGKATQAMLTEAGIACKQVNRVSQAHPNILDMIASGTVDLIINTPTKGRKHDTDGFKIRRSAVEHSVGCVTAIDTARAMLTVRQQGRSEDLTPIDITKI